MKDNEPKPAWTTADEYTAAIRRAIQHVNDQGIDAEMHVGSREKWLPKLDDNGSPLLTASGEIAFKIPTGEVDTVIEVWAPQYNPTIRLEINLGSKQNPIAEPRIGGLKLFTWVEPATPPVKAEAAMDNKTQRVLKLALEDAISEVRKRLAQEQANLTAQAATQSAPPNAAPTRKEQTAAGAGQGEAMPQKKSKRKRVFGLRIDYLIGGVALGILISIASLFVFPEWARSNILLVILFPFAFAAATNFIANFRKAYE